MTHIDRVVSLLLSMLLCALAAVMSLPAAVPSKCCQCMT